MNFQERRWTAFVDIPSSYFPPNITKMNAFAMHNGNEIDSRVYEALYPAPRDDPNYPKADL